MDDGVKVMYDIKCVCVNCMRVCMYVCMYVRIDQVCLKLFGCEEKPENLVCRAVNERSRVGNSYCTLGIQRGGLLLLKVEGSFGIRRDFLALHAVHKGRRCSGI